MFTFRFEDAFTTEPCAQEAARYEAALSTVKQALSTGNGIGAKPCIRAAFDSAQLVEINTHADKIRAYCTDMVVMGTGGSSLGAKMLVEALAPAGKTPKMHFVENTDLQTLTRVWQDVDPATTGLMIISKSGHTVEALAPAIWWLEKLDDATRKNVAAHSVAIAVESENPLRALATHYGINCLTHATDVEGRFSIFTAVGLLPAAVAGIDIAAFLQGAQRALNDELLSAAAKSAAWQVAWMNHGRQVHSMWMYGDKMLGLGQWFRQGWCESIGKEGKGSLVVEARGSVDQHSVLQLILDGPADKLVSLFTLCAEQDKTPLAVPAPLQSALGFLGGKTMSQMLCAQAQMTANLMRDAAVPMRHVHMEGLNAETVGALVMTMMLEIVMAAELMEINAFNQPAIEDSKRLIREHLKQLPAA